ncbi:hypothetical protein CCACVL1_17754, partial [Corchorus capsularis]
MSREEEEEKKLQLYLKKYEIMVKQ